MPELPEVETTARGLQRELIGRRITGVSGIDWPRMVPTVTPEDLALALVGRVIVGVGRRGKFLIVDLDDQASLAIHRKMSGNVLLEPGDVPVRPHTHLVLTLDDGRSLRLVDARKFSRVHLLRTSTEAEVFFGERLGADPLLELTAADLRRLLVGRRGRLKSLLLDQRYFPGMGNLYADEVLWAASLHPLRNADSLKRAEIELLYVSIRTVLEEAIQRRGTSFNNYRDQADQPGENQDFLRVFGRTGQPCPRCGSEITKQWIGARGTHTCPKCQRLPRRSSRLR